MADKQCMECSGTGYLAVPTQDDPKGLVCNVCTGIGSIPESSEISEEVECDIQDEITEFKLYRDRMGDE